MLAQSWQERHDVAESGTRGVARAVLLDQLSKGLRKIHARYVEIRLNVLEKSDIFFK